MKASVPSVCILESLSGQPLGPVAPDLLNGKLQNMRNMRTVADRLIRSKTSNRYASRNGPGQCVSGRASHLSSGMSPKR